MADIALDGGANRRRNIRRHAAEQDVGLGFYKGISIALVFSGVFWFAVANIVWSALT